MGPDNQDNISGVNQAESPRPVEGAPTSSEGIVPTRLQVGVRDVNSGFADVQAAALGAREVGKAGVKTEPLQPSDTKIKSRPSGVGDIKPTFGK